jgi:hypothetical protein
MDYLFIEVNILKMSFIKFYREWKITVVVLWFLEDQMIICLMK